MTRALWGVFLAAGPVFAAPIFTQAPGTPTFAPFADSAQPQFIADNFTLGATDTVRSLSWDGAYYSGDLVPPVIDDFTVAFMNDAGAVPGSVIASITVASSRVVSGTAFGSTLFTYTADLGAGVLLPGGTQLWVAIFNNTATDDDVWAWMDRQAPGGSIAFNSSGPGTSWSSFGGGFDQVFTLDNANLVAPVPEPSTLSLLGLGLIGAAVRRRRAARQSV